MRISSSCMRITGNLRLRDIFLNGMVEETTRLEKTTYKYANPNLGFSLSCVLSCGDCANLIANGCILLIYKISLLSCSKPLIFT